MNKLLCLVCCSLLLFSGCGSTSYFQSTELVESTETSESDNTSDELEEHLESDTIYVQVSGAVENPDVYQLPADARVFNAIQAAGGLLDTADDSDINQAESLTDGQKIYIYNVDEVKEMESQKQIDDADDGLININTASASELTSLSGIGDAKAAQIVSYREANGDFSSIEDIKNVSGIGDGIFNQIKDYIKV